jgi:aspartyl-tRNA(Asn)/glutamyl-tRNA(Gln) amidotransferase subunit B
MQGEIRRRLKDLDAADMSVVPVTAGQLAELLSLTERGTVSSTVAKDVFDRMWSSGGRASDIIERERLAQVGDESHLAALVAQVLAAQAEAVAQYRSGRTNILGFLVGQVMKASGGKANPAAVNAALRKKLAD